MNKILCILRRTPLAQELVSCGAEMEAHVDDVRLGNNAQEDHILLLDDFFTDWQERTLCIKHETCEFMLGCLYHWWTPGRIKDETAT